MRRTTPPATRRPRPRAAAALLSSALLAGTGAAGAICAPAAHAAQTPYLIGTGMYDITGAVAETGAFGYAASQEMSGLHQRLYARAFVIGDPASGRRVVFVSADLGAVFPSVKTGVVAKLQQRFGGRYGDANVMITATHTHVATSGLAFETLYQIAGADSKGYGYDRRNLDTVINGITESIARADANVAPGDIALASGELAGVTKNRSLPAYQANTDAASFSSSVDTTMTQLKFTGADGAPVGLLNWFATHPTSFSMKWNLLSGDNKGFAQYAFEQKMGTNPALTKTFVAAFSNTDTGDAVSTQGNANSAPGYGGDANEYVNAEIAGRQQFDKATQLWDGSGQALGGGVDYRSRWVDFGDYTVGAAYTNGAGDKRLCTSARGFSFAAGGENGPSGVPGIYEGMTKGTFSLTDAYNQYDRSALGTLVRTAFGAISLPWQDPCQESKPVLLPDGAWGWSPRVLPVQLFRVGSLAILSIPGEPTTMAGRRLRETALAQLQGSGVQTVVVASMANAYAGYVATPEEFARQHYEGASTEFGPHELGAFRQETTRLATAMRDGQPVSDDRAPVLPSQALTAQRPGVVFDDVPLGQEFGQVLTQPAASYGAGQTASAVFRAGHPKNDYRTQRSFLAVQRWTGSAWEDYLTDRDWDTSYVWAREGVAYSRATVQWRIRQGTPAGTYRLVQTGDWKNGWTGRISPYTGASQQFTVS